MGMKRKARWTAEVRKAIRASIAVWEKKHAKMPELNTWSDGDCALCVMFDRACGGSPGCFKCPVGIVTKKEKCRNTPFNDAYHAYLDQNEKAWKEYSARELEFLRSLL